MLSKSYSPTAELSSATQVFAPRLISMRAAVEQRPSLSVIKAACLFFLSSVGISLILTFLNILFTAVCFLSPEVTIHTSFAFLYVPIPSVNKYSDFLVVVSPVAIALSIDCSSFINSSREETSPGRASKNFTAKASGLRIIIGMSKWTNNHIVMLSWS